MAELSVFQAKKEVRKYAELAHRMFNFIPASIIETDKKEFQNILEKVSKYEEITDRVEVEITTFLIKISRKQLSSQAAEELRRMRIVSSEVEKIGDMCYKMSSLLAEKRKEKIYFTPAQRSDLFEMFKLINNAFELALNNMQVSSLEARKSLPTANEMEKEINAFRDQVRTAVIDDMEKDPSHVKSAFYFNKLITSCEKIGDTLLNINEAIAGINIE